MSHILFLGTQSSVFKERESQSIWIGSANYLETPPAVVHDRVSERAAPRASRVTYPRGSEQLLICKVNESLSVP